MGINRHFTGGGGGLPTGFAYGVATMTNGVAIVNDPDVHVDDDTTIVATAYFSQANGPINRSTLNTGVFHLETQSGTGDGFVGWIRINPGT